MTIKPELATERLLLRAFRIFDVDDVLAWANNEEWSRFLTTPFPYRRDDAERYIARQLVSDWSMRPTFAIVVCGKAVGSVGVRIDHVSGLAKVDYTLARPYWGRGLMTDAVDAAMDWVFTTQKVAKIVATADIENVRSWRVMERVGMKREATFRGHVVAADDADRRENTVHYGILREEWEAT